MSKLNQAGDTIVEVLMVIIVIGLVLSSAYAIAVRSLQDTQTTQERAYALKLAEGQLENLRAAASTGNAAAILSNGAGFCLDSTLQPYNLSSGAPAATAAADNFTNYPKECHQDPNDLANSCDSYCYYFGIKRVGSTPPDSNSYTATVRWDSSRGVRQQVSLTYRIYAQ